jgi:hypothetical protein
MPRLINRLLTLGVLGGATMVALPSDGAWRNVVPAFDCYQQSGTMGRGGVVGTSVTIEAGAWNWGVLKCALREDDRLYAGNVTSLDVMAARTSPYYGSADPYMKIQACVGYWDNIGGHCGAVKKKWTDDNVHPDLSSWNQGNGLPYVHINGMTDDRLYSITAYN